MFWQLNCCREKSFESNKSCSGKWCWKYREKLIKALNRTKLQIYFRTQTNNKSHKIAVFPATTLKHAMGISQLPSESVTSFGKAFSLSVSPTARMPPTGSTSLWKNLLAEAKVLSVVSVHRFPSPDLDRRISCSLSVLCVMRKKLNYLKKTRFNEVIRRGTDVLTFTIHP